MGHDMFPYYDREGNRKYLEDITWNADNSKNVRISLVNQAVRELKAQQQGVAEGSRNAYLKHNNLVDLEKPLAGLWDEFNKLLRTHDPAEKQKYQQGIKDRIKTSTMAGPKGVLPEQGVAEGISDYQKVSRDGTKAHLAGKTELTSWKKEGPWKKTTTKDPRGKAPNLSDKARRETEKSFPTTKKV